MSDKNETLSQIEQHLSALDELFRDVTLDTNYVHALEVENAELRMENEALKDQLQYAREVIHRASIDFPVVICDNLEDARRGNSVAGDMANFHDFDISEEKRNAIWVKTLSSTPIILLASVNEHYNEWWQERLPHALPYEAWRGSCLCEMEKEGISIREWLKHGLEYWRLAQVGKSMEKQRLCQTLKPSHATNK